MPFVHEVVPRFAEVDMQGVVFNAHWLTYFDDSATRFFEHLGFDPKQTFKEGGAFDVMVVRAVLDWRGSATFEDQVAIAVTADRIGSSSFDLRFAASVDGRDVCEGVITYVSVVQGEKRSTPIPQVLRERLEQAGTSV